MPMRRTITLLKLQETTIRQYVRAFAPWTKYGVSSPPAPSEFIAANHLVSNKVHYCFLALKFPPHIPGARKLQTPNITAL